jgi:transcriptional regulator with XRE-family HTH domain
MRDIQIAIRAHTEFIPAKAKSEKSRKGKDRKKNELPLYGKRVMVLDTETTIDELQNLNFGQAWIFEGKGQALTEKKPKSKYLFYADDLPLKDLETLERYAKEKGLTLLSRTEFIEKVFFPEIWELCTLLVCFNLPFDVSRLATKAVIREKGKHRDKFEFFFSNIKHKPRIMVKPIDSKKAFVEFHGSYHNSFKGRFLDLKTLVFALTNESHNLKSAGELYRCEHIKMDAEDHGEITHEYLDYNTNDLWATWDLYCAVKTEFDKHPIVDHDDKPLEAGKAFSPASIGKGYYRAMGILPFEGRQSYLVTQDGDPSPDEITGYAMTAYYGGRSECHIRRQPVKVFHTDIASMYPSVFCLQHLWDWVIAKKLYVQEATEEVRSLVDGLTIDRLFEQEIWKQIPGLVLIKPDGDLLPVRGDYSKDRGFQIGLNHLTVPDSVLKTEGTEGMWFTLADVIAAKILTGKTPAILKAYLFKPSKGKQDGLRPVKLRGEITVDPKENFFKNVIEMRIPLKKEAKRTKDPETDAMQTFLKILANSTSYGVFIELNRVELEKEGRVEYFGLSQISPEKDTEYEEHGRFYNPLIAVMITGAARLVLAMMQKSVEDQGGTFAFCDTDSMSIADLKNGAPEKIGRNVIEKFKALVPYDKGIFGEKSLLEAEDCNWVRKDWKIDEDGGNLNSDEYFDLYCYMISAKRYVMYNIIPDKQAKQQIIIRKKSDHGLGHLLSPIESKKRTDWVKEVWRYILSIEYNLPFTEPDWFYEFPAFAQLSISKPSIYRLLNPERDITYKRQIKPFNFILTVHPAEDDLFHRGNNTVQEFYCEKYGKIGQGQCNNQTACEFSKICLANRHIFPIFAFRGKKDFPNWADWSAIEKTTKQSLKDKLILSNNRSPQWLKNEEEKRLREIDGKVKEDMERYCPGLKGIEYEKEFERRFKQMGKWYKQPDGLSNQEGKITVKNYFDFIEGYSEHPESKYDDLEGNMCNSRTKGLLKPTHLQVKSIIHIGKEAETIQDEEEQAILPEEMREAIKKYHRVSKMTYRQLKKQALYAYDALPEVETIKNLRKAGIKSNSLTNWDKVTVRELIKRFPGMIRKTGVYAVDVAAQDFGFESSDDLIETFLSVPSREDFIRSHIAEQCSYMEIDLETLDWESQRFALKDGLKEKGITQKQFTERLNIPLRTLEDWISGRRLPPSEAQIKIIVHGKRAGIRFPHGREPGPKHFRDDPYPVSRLSRITAQLDDRSMAAFRSKFPQFIFRLYPTELATELVYLTPEISAYVKSENDRLRKTRDDARTQATPNLKIIGIDFGSADKARTEVSFEVDDIKEIWVMREIGKGYPHIQVELHNGSDHPFTIYKKHNRLAFDLHIFPDPVEEFKKAKERGQTTPPTKGKYPKEYTKERKPFSGEFIPIESVSYHYRVRIEDIVEDIEAGIFLKTAVSKKDGRFFMNSVTAWKYYGKGKQAKEKE